MNKILRIYLVVGLKLAVPGCQKLKAWMISFVEFEGEIDPTPTAIAMDSGSAQVQLVPVGTGLRMPTDIQPVPGQASEVVVLQKTGTAVVLNTETGKKQSLLQVDVKTDSEMGLLGLAFHPEFAKNKLFYLHYNPKAGESRSRIAEWSWQKKKPQETRVLLEVMQPYPNHNGGQIRFGPDGFLYIGLGDGGWADDPHGNGQNRKTLLGSILRLDVQSTNAKAKRSYAIPKSNPYVKKTGRDEIYAIGLRNPWKFDFDPQGRLVVADVGQNKYEEVTFVQKGGNYGWNIFEGNHCFKDNKDCSLKKKWKAPLWEYGHELGNSITGGVLIRDPRFPLWQHRFIVGDYSSGRIWVLKLPKKSDGVATAEEVGNTTLNISTFGTDGRGHIYVGDFGGGTIYKLSPIKK